jgi:hypothetical protein
VANVQNYYFIRFYGVENDEWVGCDRHAPHAGFISSLRHLRDFSKSFDGPFDTAADRLCVEM